MRNEQLRGWDLATVMVSELDSNGFIGVQVDAQGVSPGVDAIPLHHTYGFASRADDPGDDGTGCDALYCKEGNDWHAWLADDPRYVDVYPSLAKGSSVQYNSRGAFGLLDADEDTWTEYIPVEFDSSGTPTKAHLVQVGLDGNGKRVIQLAHADGYLLSMHEDDGVQLRTSDQNTVFIMKPGEITMQANKITLKGNVYAGAAAEAGVALNPSSASTTVFISA